MDRLQRKAFPDATALCLSLPQTFTTANAAFYNTSTFAAKAAQAKSFLSLLPSYLDGRSVTLQNMVSTSRRHPALAALIAIAVEHFRLHEREQHPQRDFRQGPAGYVHATGPRARGLARV
jgi:hypothetical protein